MDQIDVSGFYVRVPSSDSTPPEVVSLLVNDHSQLNITITQSSQSMTIQPGSDIVSLEGIATDTDGGIKTVSLWATYTYFRDGQTSGPGLAGAPVTQDRSNAGVGQNTLKTRVVNWDFNLNRDLGSWSSLRLDIWVEGENFYGGKQRTPVVSLTYPPVPIVEAGLYRESAQPEVYYISAGKKIHIPTIDALTLMGYSLSDVKVVAAGALGSYARFNIPSFTATPGSLVYPPDTPKHFPLTGIANTTRIVSRGKEIQLAELYGWLKELRCGDGEDFWYLLELDTDWALAQGIDLHRILRVGNCSANFGIPLTGYSPRKSVALPIIKVELDCWPRSSFLPPGSQKPGDWTNSPGVCDLVWPFDPYQPNPAGPRLPELNGDLDIRGPYVRIAGSLVTDSPHEVLHRPGTILSRYLAWTSDTEFEWEGAVPDWEPGVATDTPDHYARWTEIHPPDLIEVIDPADPRFKDHTVTTRAVALAARVAATPGPIIPSCEEVEFDIFPEAPRPPNSQIAYEELRGPETYFPWGENNDNGSWITLFDDHIRVKAKVCGGALGGSPGRFKAIYRVWWKVMPPGEIRRTGSFVTPDKDDIHYVIEPHAVASDIVEFQLCLGPGLTWEKKLNLPDGIGNSWDLIVRDNKRCDTNSLWAGQVLNGQKLTFSKAKEFGRVRAIHTLALSDLGTLPGGTRVTFTWMKD